MCPRLSISVFFTFAFSLLSFPTTGVLAATYYVDATGGLDTNDGISSGTPWKTIAKVNNAVSGIGDDVLFKRGETFSDSNLWVDWSGSPSDEVIIGTYGSGAKPMFTYTGLSMPPIAVGVSGASHITFQDLGIDRNGVGGSCVSQNRDNVSHITIRNLEISNCFNGITLSKVDTFTITGNTVTDSDNNGIYIGGSALYKAANGTITDNVVTTVSANDGITIHEDGSGNGAGSNFTIAGNTISGCAENGIDINTGTGVIVERNVTHGNVQGGILVGSSGVTIRYNRSYDDSAGTSAAFNINGSSDVTLHHNIGYGTSYHQLSINGDAADTVKAYNNTFILGTGTTFDLSYNLENITVENNIIHGRDATQIVRFFDVDRPPDHPTFLFDRNLYHTEAVSSDIRHFYVLAAGTWKTFAQMRDEYGRELNGMETDPFFADYAGNDFALMSPSPGIDGGASPDFYTATTTDFLGNPIYGAPDIGAYEYQPPHTMGVDRIDISAGARVYGDGKFRDVSTAGGVFADLSVAPQSGTFPVYGSTDARPRWMDISDIIWETSGTRHKRWTESGSTLGSTATIHTVGDLESGKRYVVSVDGVSGAGISGADGTLCTNGACRADAQGRISFLYTGGYSTHTFDVTEGGDAEAEDYPDLEVSSVRYRILSPVQTRVSFKTNNGTVASVRFGTDPYHMDRKKTENVREKKHVANLRGLLPGTRYYFRITAKDRYGQEDKSRVHSFVTPEWTTRR